MSRAWFALAAVAAIAAVILVLNSDDPDPAGPHRPPRSAPSGGPSGGKPGSEVAESEVGCIIRGTVRRAGVGIPATLEFYLMFPGERDARGPSSLSSEVWLTRVFSAAEPVRTCDTAADGSFRIEGLMPGEYRIAARAEGGATGFARADLPVEGVVAEVDLNLPDGRHTLRGRVVTAAGEPLTALVWVVPGPRPMTVMNQLEGTAPLWTGRDGSFAIAGLTEGTVNVTVLEPGRLFTCRVGVGIPREEDLVLVVDEGFVEVSGRILAEDDGSPVAGARVSIWGRVRGRASTVGASTAVDGTFRTAVPPGEISIGARAEGFLPLRVKHQATDSIEIRLSRWAIVTGEVVASDGGGPVAGVPVRARTLDTGKRSRLRTDTVSGPDGTFRFEVASGDIMVYAFGNGWISEEFLTTVDPKQCRTAFILAAGEERKVTLRVSPAARAEGVVLDDEGNGIAGAVVWANAVGEVARAPTAPPHRPAGTTDGDGQFTIDTLVPGFPYNFSTRPPGHGWHRSEVYVADVSEPIRVEFRLPKPRWIVVRVLDAGDGHPIAGARVKVSNVGGEWRTGEDGTVTAGPASPTKITVWADHPDYVEVRRWGPVPQLEEVADSPSVDLRLKPAFRISGHAILDDGRPHTTGTVYTSLGAAYSGATIPGKDGSFRISRLAAGVHKVEAQGVRDGRAYHGEVRVAAGTQDVKIVLRDRGAAGITSASKARIRVRAVDREGNPVVGGMAQLFGENRGAGRKLSGGVAQLFYMSNKDVRVLVSGARNRTGEHLAATLSAPVDLDRREVTVVLRPALAVSGRLVDEDENPVGGVLVHAVGRFDLAGGANTPEGWHAHARTARDGSFTLTGLGDARYRLELELPTIYSKPKNLDVFPGGPPLTIRLGRALSGVLRVSGPDGRPVGGAEVRISGSRTLPGGRFMGSGSRIPPPRTDPAGQFRFGPLDPRYEYELRVLPPEGREELAEFVVSDWKPADMSIRLEEGLPLRGRVLLIGGRTLPEMKVWCKPAGGSSRAVKPGEDGRFSFSNLPPGTVELGIRLDRIGMVTWDRRIEVQAGRTDVVYEVDLGLPLFVEIENWPKGQREYSRFARLEPSSGMPENPSLVPSARLGKKIRFEGLPANETYTLRILGMDDGTCYVGSGIRASTEPLRVRLVPGKSIRGRLIIPPGHGRAWVSARSAAASVSGKVAPDGTFEVRGLPEGDWRVVAQASGSGDSWSQGEAVVAAGEEATITLVIRDD